MATETTGGTTGETTVLVTGAGGFIAQHCVTQLLAAGYRVRGTVRSAKRADELRKTLVASGGADRLELVEADLTADAGWDAACAGCRYVLHVASPFPAAPPKNPDDLIVPARDGALRVLRAAAKAHAQRVVITSSLAAVLGGHPRDRTAPFDERDWTVLGPRVGAYPASKTIAEKAAWDFVAALPAGESLELVTINPGLVLGPMLDGKQSTSAEMVRKLMKREIPGCADIGFPCVDVRDVASAHVAAMTSPAAAGQRFCCAERFATMVDIAVSLKGKLAGRYKITTRRLPNWAIRLFAKFDKSARLIVDDLGRRPEVSSAKLRDTLHWSPRGLDEMVGSMAESLIQFGLA